MTRRNVILKIVLTCVLLWLGVFVSGGVSVTQDWVELQQTEATARGKGGPDPLDTAVCAYKESVEQCRPSQALWQLLGDWEFAAWIATFLPLILIASLGDDSAAQVTTGLSMILRLSSVFLAILVGIFIGDHLLRRYQSRKQFDRNIHKS